MAVTLLMTYPDYFKPGSVDAYRWHLMKAMLGAAGAEIVTPGSALNRPYVRNEYVQVGQTLVFGNTLTQAHDSPSMDAYSDNVLRFTRRMAHQHGLKIRAIGDLDQANGGNILPLPEKNAILIGCLSSEEAREQLSNGRKVARAAGMKLEPVLITVRKDTPADVGYDLDLFVSQLPHGELLVHKESIDVKSLHKLESLVGSDKIIGVSQPLACNQMSVGDYLVMPVTDKALRQELQSRGYKVIDKETIMSDARLRDKVAASLTADGFEVGQHLFNNQYTGNKDIDLHFEGNASFRCITNSLTSARDIGARQSL